MKFRDGLIVIALFAASIKGQNGTAASIDPATVDKDINNNQTENSQPQKTTIDQLQRNKELETIFSATEYDFFKRSSPNATEITSKNYPMAYPAKSQESWNIVVENYTGIELCVHFLDIDPTKDFLKIHIGDIKNSKDTGLILTGKLKAALKLRSLHSPQLHIEFSSSTTVGHSHQGFLLTYIPIGEIPESTVKPEEATIAPEKPHTYSILLSIPQVNQNNETWDLFRSLLCQAANNISSKYNLSLEYCQPSSVIFEAVVNCPSLWPNNLNCVEIIFSIRLHKNESKAITTIDPLNGDQITFPKELSDKNLKLMWNEFGRKIFKTNKFEEYKSPETSGLIFFWTGMATAATVVFLLILVIISRLRVLRNYVKWPSADEDNQNILKQTQDIDITMFPSPHQVVPNLFPSSTIAYSPGSSFMYGGDVYENRPRELTECINETDPSLLSELRRKSSSGMDNQIVIFDGDDRNRMHRQDLYDKETNKNESVS